jgi:hypothetical protein
MNNTSLFVHKSIPPNKRWNTFVLGRNIINISMITYTRVKHMSELTLAKINRCFVQLSTTSTYILKQTSSKQNSNQMVIQKHISNINLLVSNLLLGAN